MPDISYQMQLLKQQQDPNSESSPMGAMRALGTSIGNAWQGYEAGRDEKDLVDFFTKEDTTPEKMQEFMVGHPRMPQVDVYTKASMIGRQKKAKVMKDASAAFVSWLKNQDPKTMTMEKFQEFATSLNLPKDVEYEFLTNFVPKGIELVKSMRPEKPGAYTLAPGAKRMQENLSGGPDTEVAYNPEDKEIDIISPDGKTTAKIPTSHFNNPDVPEWKGWRKGTPAKETQPSIAQQHVDEIMRTPRADGTFPTKKEAIEESKKKPTTPTVPYEIIEDLGNGMQQRKVWDEKAKAHLASGKPRPIFAPHAPVKPDYTAKEAMTRISTIDSTIAKLNTTGEFDKFIVAQNPQLATFFESKDPEAVKQAIFSLESERAEVIKFAPKGYGAKKEEPVVEPIKKYKTADEVKAAFAKGTITKDEAVKILRKDFGMD